MGAGALLEPEAICLTPGEGLPTRPHPECNTAATTLFVALIMIGPDQ